MKTCVIFCAGGFSALAEPIDEEDLVIAADGGLRHTEQCGVQPTLILGDFDSLGYTPDRAEVFPVEKDDTDTFLAAKYGMEQGSRTFHIYGGTGGRLDHLLGNLQILAFISEKAPGTAAEILGSHERVWLLDGGSLSIQGKPESTFSVLCHSDRAEGVTIRGARFGLENAVMTNRFPLGISNRIGEERIATISVEKGILFVIYPKEV